MLHFFATFTSTPIFSVEYAGKDEHFHYFARVNDDIILVARSEVIELPNAPEQTTIIQVFNEIFQPFSASEGHEHNERSTTNGLSTA